MENNGFHGFDAKNELNLSSPRQKIKARDQASSISISCQVQTCSEISGESTAIGCISLSGRAPREPSRACFQIRFNVLPALVNLFVLFMD
jgi:hypothetical protein